MSKQTIESFMREVKTHVGPDKWKVTFHFDNATFHDLALVFVVVIHREDLKVIEGEPSVSEIPK